MDGRPPLLIGVCGFAGTGKDTVAAFLKEKYGFEQRAFADKIREFAAILNTSFPLLGETYNQVVERLGYEQAKRTHPCVREHLIAIGHGLRTVFHRDILLDSALPPTGFTADSPLYLVISDVRNQNEAARIKALGGFVWRITRPGVAAAHDTEAASLAAVRSDFTLGNAGTIEELTANVVKLIDLCSPPVQ